MFTAFHTKAPMWDTRDLRKIVNERSFAGSRYTPLRPVLLSEVINDADV